MKEEIRVNQIIFCYICFLLVDITRMKDMSTFPFTKMLIADIMTSIDSTVIHETVSEDLKTTSSTTDLASVSSFPYKKPL